MQVAQQQDLQELGTLDCLLPCQLRQCCSSYGIATACAPLLGTATAGDELTGTAHLRKSLSQLREHYSQTGHLEATQAVQEYLLQLEQHRATCACSGRYAEADAARRRIRQLHTALAQQLRAQLIAQQRAELERLHQAYERDTRGQQGTWDDREAQYEAVASRQAQLLQQQHQQQLAALEDAAAARRPSRPQPSGQYLEQRQVERLLARQGEYLRAQGLRDAADALWQQDLTTTLASHEAEVRLRRAHLQQRQQTEVEALAMRAARGRDEMEARRTEEAARRQARLRAAVHELDSMHRMEVVHLDNFLSGRCIAGKAAAPLMEPDAAAGRMFQRKRVLLEEQAPFRSQSTLPRPPEPWT